ncbi:right-handed parallel beta-helix repeat-containing protein [Lawsonibacter sp. LCP25S3_F5]
MTGITIDGNRALRQGGGIYLNNKSTTITDSTISNNFVDIITTDTETDGIYGSGGGIFTVSSATDCTIQNTKITNNTANALASWLGGGGIYTDGNTAMTLIGCTISGNQAANASGGGIQNRGTLTLQDTTVSNNTAKLSGGGIDHREKTVSVLGSVVISGNTVNGKANNFYPEYRTPPKDNPATPAEFNSNSLVIVTGQLTPGASIGVTLPDQLTQLTTTVAKGTDTYNVTSSDAAYFTYDSGNKLVQKATDGSNTLVLADAATIRTVTFNLPEQVKVSCANPVQVKNGENLTVTFDVAYGYKLKYAYELGQADRRLRRHHARGEHHPGAAGDHAL